MIATAPSPLESALTARLAPLGFAWLARAGGWRHDALDLVAVYSLKAVRLERLCDGRSWTFHSARRRPEEAAQDLALQIARALEEKS